MNAQTPIVPAEALQLAATNADILRAVRDGAYLTPGEVAKACGRETKNISRDVSRLVDMGLLTKPQDGPYALTGAGERALIGIDIVFGLRDAPAGDDATDTADSGDVLHLLHHQIRPNPHQPRQHFPREELDALKATIVAAGDVLHNLVVYPADAEGVHDLSDGERRWRMVGELIEEGMWPVDRPLRAIQRERTPGDVAFIGLISAQQGRDLTVMDKARAYQTLCADKEWSARRAALETGGDVRTVQEMLRVLAKGDPDDIAAFEAGKEGWTWERLRDTVKERREAEPEPAQPDLVEIAAPPAQAAPPPIIGGGGGTSQPPKPAKVAAGPDTDLTPVQRLAMLELHLKSQALADEAGWVRVRKYWLDTAASDLQSLGLVVFSHTINAQGPHAGFPDAGRAWVAANLADQSDAAVAAARQAAGASTVSAYGDAWVTPWLNESEAPRASDGEGDQPDPRPTPQPSSSGGDADRETAEAERQALVAAATPTPEEIFGRFMVGPMAGAPKGFGGLMEDDLRWLQEVENFAWHTADVETLAARLTKAMLDGEAVLMAALCGALWSREAGTFSKQAIHGALNKLLDLRTGATPGRATADAPEA